MLSPRFFASFSSMEKEEPVRLEDKIKNRSLGTVFLSPSGES